MPVKYVGAAAQTLYVLFDDSGNTAHDMTEGTSYKVGIYTLSDATIDAGPLTGSTTPYIARVCIGTAAGKVAGDQVLASTEFVWDGTTEDTLDAQIKDLEASTPVVISVEVGPQN